MSTKLKTKMEDYRPPQNVSSGFNYFKYCAQNTTYNYLTIHKSIRNTQFYVVLFSLQINSIWKNMKMPIVNKILLILKRIEGKNMFQVKR